MSKIRLPERTHRSGTPLPQQAQNLVESLATDELHGVIVDALARVNVEDRNDVGVVKPGGSPCLAAKPTETQRIERRTERQDLKSNVATQRLVECFIDDAHPAAPYLANNPIVTQPLKWLPFRATIVN